MNRRLKIWRMDHRNCKNMFHLSIDGMVKLMYHISSLFMHGGHTSRISDFSFNLNDPWLMCSADEVNLVQIWKTTDSIIGPSKPMMPLNELER